jgi:predicted acetyltransferase
MATRIRTVGDSAEYASALGGIGHYFGGAWAEEDARRFERLLPLDRMYAAVDGDAIVAGAGSIPFELTVPGGVVPCAGVTVVGVLPTHRRRGILTRLMETQLADVRERGEPVAALWASEETIYRRFGYGLAHLVAMSRVKKSAVALHADLPVVPATARLVGHDEALAAFPPIYERARRRTTGFLSRSRDWWEVRKLDDAPERRRGSGELNRILLELDGRPAGYALYRIKFEFGEAGPASTLRVVEAVADSSEATRELWRFLLAIDWMEEIEAHLLPVDHPLFLLVQRPNSLNWKVFDGVWVRLVDVGAALAARGLAGDGRVTFDVASDPLLPENVGTWTVEGGDARRSRLRADVRLDVQALGSAYLGGFTFAELARAGRAEEVARGGIARADALFRVERKPWCPEVF